MKKRLYLFTILVTGTVLVGCGNNVTVNVPTADSPQVVTKGQAPLTPEVVVTDPIPVITIPEEVSPAPDYGPILTRAIGGYDPVSYFSGTPQSGIDGFHVTHSGATYYFASAENRDAFYDAPDKFAPAYGGWCAYAIAKTGDLVEVNPNTYKIVDGRLHLFYNKHLINTLKLWNLNEADLNVKAKANWQKLVSEGKARVNTDQ